MPVQSLDGPFFVVKFCATENQLTLALIMAPLKITGKTPTMYRGGHFKPGSFKTQMTQISGVHFVLPKVH